MRVTPLIRKAPHGFTTAPLIAFLGFLHQSTSHLGFISLRARTLHLSAALQITRIMPRLQPKAPHLTPLLGSGSPLGFRAPHPRTRHSSASAQPISGQDTASHFSASVQLHFASGTPRLHNRSLHAIPRLQLTSTRIKSRLQSTPLHPAPRLHGLNTRLQFTTVHRVSPLGFSADHLTSFLGFNSERFPSLHHSASRRNASCHSSASRQGITPHVSAPLHIRTYRHDSRLQGKAKHHTSDLGFTPQQYKTHLGSASAHFPHLTPCLGFTAEHSITLQNSPRLRSILQRTASHRAPQHATSALGSRTPHITSWLPAAGTR